MSYRNLLAVLCLAYLAMQVRLGIPQELAEPARWGLLALAAGMGFLLCWGRPWPRLRTWILPGLAAYLGLAGLTVFASDAFPLPFLKWLALFLQCLVFAWFAPRLLGRRDWERFSTALLVLVGAVVVASLALVVLAPGQAFRAGRLAGLSNANSIGIVSMVCGSFALWELDRPSLSRNGRRLVYLLFALALVALFLTRSRSSLGGLLVGAALWLRVSERGRRWLLLLVPVAGLFLLSVANPEAVFYEAGARVLRGSSLEEITSSREGVWRASYESWQKRPLLGYGYGVSGIRYRSKSLTQSVGAVRDGSGYLGVLESVGVFGCLGLAALYASVALALGRLARDRRSRRSPHGALALKGGGVFFSLASNAFGEPWLLGPGSFPHLVLFASLGMVLAGAEAPRARRARRRPAPASAPA